MAGVAACGSSPETLHIWYSTDDPAEAAWAVQLGHLFAEAHKGINVSLKAYAFEDFNPKMQLSLGAGDPPDLAYATPRVCGIPIYIQSKKLVDLTPYAKHYGWASRLRRGLLQDYNSPFALYATHDYGVQPRNVQVYAVPDALAAVGVMYNTRLLHRLHLTIPDSLAQFRSDVTAAKKAGYIPLGMGNLDGWLGDDWYQTLDNTQFSYADLERELRVDSGFTFQRPQFESMAAVLDGWKNDFTPDFAGLDAQGGMVDFFQGRTLFQLISSSEDSQIGSLEQQTRLPISVFAFPGTTAKSTRVMPQSGYEGWIVPKAGHNLKAAVEFINWVLSPSTTTFLLKHGVLPAEPVAPADATSGWQRAYLQALRASRPGVFLDAAPMPNLNATMEANVQLLLGPSTFIEGPSFLPQAMQTVYSSHGEQHGKVPQIDCEF